MHINAYVKRNNTDLNKTWVMLKYNPDIKGL